MMGAADALARAVGSRALLLPRLHVSHAECERRAQEALGDEEFDAARQHGSTMSFDKAVAYAVGEGG